LNYIAILQEVEDFIIAVEGNNEVVKTPGPWVITVYYKARGKIKTLFILVKATVERKDDKEEAIFYHFHPSQA